MNSVSKLFSLYLFVLPFIIVAQVKFESPRKVLFVTSNQTTYGVSEKKTANHFAEIVLAYDVFTKAGFIVDVISPKGGKIPLGYFDDSNPTLKKYRSDSKFMKLFHNTLSPLQVNASDYVAIYFSGGGAAMFGVPKDKNIQKLTREIYNRKGIVSAVCHGTAGISQIKETDGSYLIANKKVSGFPDQFENKEAQYFKTFPFSIETEIEKNGGNFMYSKKGWDGYYIKDGRLITGQDPSSTIVVSQQVVKALSNNNQ